MDIPQGQHKVLVALQEVERDCGHACLALNLPLPVSISLQLGEGRSVYQELIKAAQQPSSAIPETPSLKVCPVQPMLKCFLGNCSDDGTLVKAQPHMLAGCSNGRMLSIP